LRDPDLTITIYQSEDHFEFRASSLLLDLSENSMGSVKLGRDQATLEQFYVSFSNPVSHTADPVSRGHELFCHPAARVAAIVVDIARPPGIAHDRL